MKKLVLLGPPGSGKGTQATVLVEQLKVLHISTGVIFREAMAANTPEPSRLATCSTVRRHFWPLSAQ